jgi:hypothetical protein
VSDKTLKAIRNNIGLYEAIFSNHQIEFNRTDMICYSLEKTPPLYSNLVTVSQHWKPDDVFRKIDSNYEMEKWNQWSIKDSFGVLDLNQYGFRKLFDAQWMYLEAENFTSIENSASLRYEIIDEEIALSAWRLVWDSDEQLGAEIFKPQSLSNPKFYYVAGYKGQEIVCGCVVNKTDEVLGISNFFAPDRDVKYWSEIVSFIFRSIEQADIVGYERQELVDKLKLLGFEAVGNLTVWLKKRSS